MEVSICAKTLLDKEFIRADINLQTIIDLFSSRFKKVGIVESFGMIGDQPSVAPQHAWTAEIAQTYRVFEC